jgi:hypothetical protein
MTGPLRIGDLVHGHLFGYFGRDHYDCARVEAIGSDWAIIRTMGGVACAGTGSNVIQELEQARDPTQAGNAHTCGLDPDDF